MSTAHGASSLTMGQYGIRRQLRSAGRPTAGAIGTGSVLGAGPGWIMRLGVLRLSAMAAGHLSADSWGGALDRSSRAPYLAPRLWAFSGVLTLLLAPVLAAVSAGSRSDLVSRFSHGSTAGAASSSASTCAT